MSMILGQGAPLQAARSLPDLFDVFTESAFIHHNFKFEQLAMYLLGTPVRIVASHLLDEFNVSRGMRDSWLLGVVQYRRKSSRWQHKMVSGWTKCRADCQELFNWVSSVSQVRSPEVKIGRLTERLSMISYCRKMAFLTRRSWLLRVKSSTAPAASDTVTGLVHFLIVSLAQENRFAGMPDWRKHNDLNSILGDLGWRRIIDESRKNWHAWGWEIARMY